MSLENQKLKIFEKLQQAIELELSTIPPYLMAMFSIKPGTNIHAATIIRSVFMEEMLHMVLAANTLTSVGGSVKLGEKNIPVYPCRLNFKGKNFKEREFDIDLAAFSKETIKTFMKIELPESLEPKKFKMLRKVIPGYTIGEFYNGIKEDLVSICNEYGESDVFNGPVRNQVTEEYYWKGGGKTLLIKNLEDALAAINIIVEQGEGTTGSLSDGDAGSFSQSEEIAHYYRFNEIYEGRKYKSTDKPHDTPSGDMLPVDFESVYPIKTNCKSIDFKNQPELQFLNNQFNANYSLMLFQLEEGFNGNPKAFYPAIMNGMHNLSTVARKMVQIQILADPENRTAAPSFEWFVQDIVN